MNIPFSILKEQTLLNKNCYDYHQNLAKKYYNLNKRNKSSAQQKLNKRNKSKIFNWFSSLDIEDKIKICCIYNNWFIKILDQLLIYKEYAGNVLFSPKMAYENFYKIIEQNFDDKNFDYSNYLNELRTNENKFPEKYFTTFFKTTEFNNGFGKTDKNQYMEKEFLNELRFFQLNDFNDTMSLNGELLNNKQKLQEYFDTFTNCKIFSENIFVIKANQNYNNIFNFSFPSWVREIQNFSIPQLIVICFEISISIYYQIFLVENIIPVFDIDSKIKDLFIMKMNMENYIAVEINKEQNEINSILDENVLNKEIKSADNIRIFEEHEKFTEYIYKLVFDRKQSFFYEDSDIKEGTIISTLNSLKKELKANIPQFLNSITFIKKNNVFKIENIICYIIYQKLYAFCSKRNFEDLFLGINEKETSKSKRKKKKNKKRKEKKEDKENNENIIIKNEINNSKEVNEIRNMNDNKFSINAEDNKNNSNISEDEEDEENQIFSNDIYSEIENSKNIKNINKTEEDIKECIEMKLLDEKGKEIENEQDTTIEKNENDIFEEILLMDNTKERKNNNNNNNKKKKKHKNKKRKNIKEEKNIEIKNEDKKEEIKEDEKKDEIKEDKKNINNNIIINKSEINLNISINEKKEINSENSEFIKEENKNKKKHKDFFLYPVEHKKDKKEKKENKNQNKKNNNINDEINIPIKKEISKDYISQTSATEKNEKNEIIKINNEQNIDDNKNIIFSETKESKIMIIGKNNNFEKSINSLEKTNKIDNTQEYRKIQNINLNNSTINNYVIIDKNPSNKILPPENKDFHNNIFPQIISTFSYSIPFNQLPNYYLYERNDLFIDLNNDILFHEENITNNLIYLEKYRKEIYEKIIKFVENVLNKNNFDAKLINYGSHETGLSIESSDIDILIKFCKKNNMNNIIINNQKNIEEILGLIYNELNYEKLKYNILQINAIYTASVPVLKIKFNLENIIPNEIKDKIKKNYIFNFEEDILQLNFDFTFQEVENINDEIKIPSLEIIPFIKSSMNIYKEIKPIILILKRFMKINKLNSSFHGGLSSYSLFLLLYSYLKYMFIPNNTLGHYLYGFFEFYSNFNFGIYCVNPKLDCPFMILDELHESGMMLIDPITSLNVAKSTFRIDQIKSVLTKGMIIIRNIFFTNKGKDYSHNLNNDKNIFLKELFKNRNGTIIVEKIFQRMQLQNQQVFGK